MYKIAVLASGMGSTLQNLEKCCRNRHGKDEEWINGKIICVVTNKDCGALKLAKLLNIPCYKVSRKDFVYQEEFNAEIFKKIDIWNVDLVALAGYTSLLSIPERYKGKVLNIHPSLLPDFGGKGYYGLHVHEAVLKSGAMKTGCTVHVVDDEYDHGEILGQEVVGIFPGDTPEILQKRVQQAEQQLYPRVIQNWLKGRSGKRDI